MSDWLIWSLVIAIAILLLGFVVALGARRRFSAMRKKFSDRGTEAGATGKELALASLEVYSLNDVAIASSSDKYANAYSIKDKTLIFSEDVLTQSSVFALAVVAHEVGHARQHNDGHVGLAMWYMLSYAERFTCMLVLPFFLVGLVLSVIPPTSIAGAILINLSTTFTFLALLNRLLSLPNEMGASKLGLEMLAQSESMTKQELRGAKKVLKAAYATYILGFYERLFLNFYLLTRASKYTIRKIKERNTKSK